MNPRPRTPWTMFVTSAVLIALAATGCDGTRPEAAASSPASDAGAAWTAAAACMRANGVPDFPDPVRNENGDWALPEVADSVPVPPACGELLRSAKQASRDGSAPTADELAKMREHARCMRENGLPAFPDPDEDGNFGLPPETENDPTFRTAYEACKRYLPPMPPK